MTRAEAAAILNVEVLDREELTLEYATSLRIRAANREWSARTYLADSSSHCKMANLLAAWDRKVAEAIETALSVVTSGE